MKSKTPLRRLAMILTVLLSVLLLPDKAAAVAVNEYDLWVGGIRVTSDNAGNVLGDGKVSFNPETGTLTLDNATINGTSISDVTVSNIGIYSKIPLTIHVTGTNTVTSGVATNYGDSYGILSENTLNVTGGGTLTATAGKGHHSSGIATYGFTLQGNTKVTATGGEAIDDGGTAGLGNYSGENSVIVKSGTLTAKGGTGGTKSFGIELSSALEMEGGTLVAEGGSASDKSYGIASVAYYAFDHIIKEGTVTLSGASGATTHPLNIADYSNPDVTVSGNAYGSGAQAWNGTTPLNDDGFKYVKIQPGVAPAGNTIAGYVWYDDGDGLQSCGDSGVPGVYVKILDADGCYSFEGLEAGTYTIQFYNIPRGCRIAPSYVGNDRTRDSDGLKRTVTLTGDLLHHDLGLLKQSVRSTRRR